MTTITFDDQLNIKKTHFKNIDEFSYYLIEKNSSEKKVLSNIEEKWTNSNGKLELSGNNFNTAENMFDIDKINNRIILLDIGTHSELYK